MYRNFYARKKYRLDDFGQYQHVVVYKLYDLVWPNSSCYRNSNVSGSFFYGRPLSVSGRPCYILPMFFFKLINLFFYGRLILRPWWTEVRESFTRGRPWVSLEKLVGPTWIFSWSPLNYRVGKKVTKFGIFSDPARKLSALTPERGRIL